MLLEDAYIENTKQELAELVSKSFVRLSTRDFRWDNYIAMSLMQKAIRRDDVTNALAGGAFFLRSNERGFWRRLSICAVEDIGIANPHLVAQVLIAAGDKRLRNTMGGSEQTASTLISALCTSPKDRSADDLFDILERVTILDEQKAKTAEQPRDALLEVIGAQTQPIEYRAIAAIQLATGWEDFDSYLRKGHEWLGVLSDLPEDVASPCITAVSKLAIRRTGLVLAPLLTLLNGGTQIPMHMVTDTFPAETDIDGLPSWALGGHVRPGLQSFRKYIDQSAQMKRLIKVAALGDVSPAQIIAGLVFRLESGQLAHRMDWETGRRLKADATACGWGIPDEAVPDAMSILGSEFDLLNDCRAQAIRNYIR